MRRVKDAALEQALLLWLRPQIRNYGTIRSLKLNTARRELSAEILLRGEATPVVIEQARYRLEGEDEKVHLIFFEIKISRTWAQSILDDHFPQIPIRIPDFVRALLA